MDYKPLPIGIEDYKELIQKQYYYIDKTLLIKELMDSESKVTLITRPRRFGKTLNMSMLRYFFEINTEEYHTLFQNTKISKAEGNYLSHMGKYPVITLSLKSMKQASYEEAFHCLKEELSEEYKRHASILDSLAYKSEQDRFLRIINMDAAPEEYLTALRFLSNCLNQHYRQNVIILIDEYDVPLENAYFSGFYDKMIGLIRSLFESSLKTNSNLAFAVITGCLRISKESIFTGLNNLNILSITANACAEYFGFTPTEVDEMLTYYGIEAQQETLQKWYDGYMFGDTEVYNPWSVVNYVNTVFRNPDAMPLPYWSNTSSNSIVRRLIDRANSASKQEIELLIEGKTIEKPVHEDVTYEDIDSTQDHLWNFLFFTGYLKKVSERMEEEIRYIRMAIPNSEVRYIYKTMVLRWFEEKVDQTELSVLYESILTQDLKTFEEQLSENLMETISFYDYQESFYHGFLAGLLKNIKHYIVLSNRESGNGRPDILLKYPSVRGKAIILEIKVASTYQELEKKCQEALDQIEDQHYEQQLRTEGYQNILKYGVAFYRKECKVMVGE